MKNVKIKKILRNLLLGIVICFSCLSTPNIEAASATRYMGVVLYNEENFELNYRIYKKDSNAMYSISQNVCNFNGPSGQGKGCKLSVEDSETPDNFILSDRGNGSTGDGIIGNFIFPNISITKSKVQATSQDFKQADIVLGTLVNDFNSGLSFIKRNSTKENAKTLSDLSKKLAKAGFSLDQNSLAEYGIGVISYNSALSNERFADTVKAIEKKVKASKEKDSPFKGLNEEDYVILYSKKDSSINPLPLIWRMPTGYGNGQIYENRVEEKNTLLSEKVSWMSLVSMAETARANGLTADAGSFDNLTSAGAVYNGLKEAIEGAVDSFGANVLGFYSLESMMLNRDARGQSYYLGMMPYDWFQKANMIFWIAEIIAVFVLIASILYTVYQENYAIVSPSTRINLQDRVQNLLIAILLLIMYVPLFYILAKFNQSIVELLDSLVNGATLSYSLNLGFILTFIMAIINLGIMIKLNFDYLVRALTITVLHIISPIAIASISISEGKNRRYFNIWLKELVSAIFMQAFDAAILVLFISILKNGAGSSRWWEVAFMSFMLVPLNSWFKQNFGGGNNIGRTAELAQGNAKTAWKNTTGAIGTAAAFAGNVIGNKRMAEDRRISSNTGSSQTNSPTGETQSETPNANGKTSYSGAKNDGDGVSKGKVITEASGTENSGTTKKNSSYKPPRNAFAEGLAITAMQSAGMGTLAQANINRSKEYWGDKKDTKDDFKNIKASKKEEKEEPQLKRLDTGQYELEEGSKSANSYNEYLKNYQEQLNQEEAKITEEAHNSLIDEIRNNPEYSGDDFKKGMDSIDYSGLINDDYIKMYAEAEKIPPEIAKQQLTNIVSNGNGTIDERKQNLAQTMAKAKINNEINSQRQTYKQEAYNEIAGKNRYDVGKKAVNKVENIKNQDKTKEKTQLEETVKKINNDKSLTPDDHHSELAKAFAEPKINEYMKENGIQRKETPIEESSSENSTENTKP